MFKKIKEILFDWPDPNDKALERINDAYDSLIEEFKFVDYTTYLRTKHWERFKEEALKKACFKCQVCNAENTVLFVDHYNYHNLGRETFDDVIVLCAACHSKFHEEK